MTLQAQATAERDLLSDVRQIAANIFEVQQAVAEGRGHLVDDLGATSVTKIEFLVALERRFDVQIEPEEIERTSTLGEVAALLEGRLRR